MNNKVQDGRIINYRADVDISGGELVSFPTCVAVAATDIAKGDLGALDVEGVFELPKSGGAISQGDALFLGADGKLAASGSLFAGVAWEDAAANAQFVACRINFGSAPVAEKNDTPKPGEQEDQEGQEG